jgi:hypothetical protein
MTIILIFGILFFLNIYLKGIKHKIHFITNEGYD